MDTEIGPWFHFPIPKPGFGRTLAHKMVLFNEKDSDHFGHRKLTFKDRLLYFLAALHYWQKTIISFD